MNYPKILARENSYFYVIFYSIIEIRWEAVNWCYWNLKYPIFINGNGPSCIQKLLKIRGMKWHAAYNEKNFCRVFKKKSTAQSFYITTTNTELISIPSSIKYANESTTNLIVKHKQDLICSIVYRNVWCNIT